MEKNFNLFINGVGGQGILTLLQIIAEAALMERYDVKTSELHGLSQRGGSVEVHLRFGKTIYSPLVSQGGADLIISLEAQESLRGCHFASKETIFLVNDFFIPIPNRKIKDKKEILKEIKKFSQKIIFIPASEICQKGVGAKITAGIFLLSYASVNNLIPLKPHAISKAIKKVIPKKYLDLNLKTFKLAK
ncbi:indolepyruvate oxidoreductase subunit beta [Patescibacteria group bacterium]|nr:indolepyruvate oxidoreductase subunit beta [Patescibacteria group bacterium]